MRKNAVKSKCSMVHFQSASHVSAILSRKGRKLWAGAQTPGDDAARMRCESPSDSYETLRVELEPAEWQDTGDFPSDEFEVKLQPQTAE
jgi:hypothetical protein